MNKELINEFLKHSNWIEREYSEQALRDAKRAWRWAYSNKNKIDLKYILKIHWLLIRNIRPDIAGKIRDCDVWIGGHRKHFISQALIKEQLELLIGIINGFDKNLDTDKKREEWAKREHIHFEDIHPFGDGNGRTGRILMNIHRLKLGSPVLLIRGWNKGDNHLTLDQIDYYNWF